MEDVPIVTMLHAEADLREPSENLVLTEIFRRLLLLVRVRQVRDLLLQVAIVAVLHDHVKISFLVHVDFL